MSWKNGSEPCGPAGHCFVIAFPWVRRVFCVLSFCFSLSFSVWAASVRVAFRSFAFAFAFGAVRFRSVSFVASRVVRFRFVWVRCYSLAIATQCQFHRAMI